MLPKELKEVLLEMHEIEQRKFYNSLPVKYVETTKRAIKETKESQENIEEITEKIKEKDKKILNLTKKLQKMEAEIKIFNDVKNTTKEKMEK